MPYCVYHLPVQFDPEQLSLADLSLRNAETQAKSKELVVSCKRASEAPDMVFPYLQLVIQFTLSVYTLHTYLDIRQLKVHRSR